MDEIDRLRKGAMSWEDIFKVYKEETGIDINAVVVPDYDKAIADKFRAWCDLNEYTYSDGEIEIIFADVADGNEVKPASFQSCSPVANPLYIDSCNCKGWKNSIDKLNHALETEAQHMGESGYNGSKMEYCPWCGVRLAFASPESKSLIPDRVFKPIAREEGNRA